MQEKRRKSSKRFRIPILPIAVAAVVIAVLLILMRGGKSADSSGSVSRSAEVAEGTAVLQELESRPIDEIETELKAIREQRLQAQCEERIAELESGGVNVWSLFTDYVLLGDSRAMGFPYYGFLSEDRCITEGGATILDLEAAIPSVAAINPSTIFLCYGLNDVSIGVWNTPEEYVTEYARIIGEIQEQLPDAEIYISSILPAHDPAFETSALWYNIPEYSQAVCEMCDTIDNCYYVDNDDICNEHYDMWDSDGIHVYETFYPYWGTNLIAAVYRAELLKQTGEEAVGQ